MTSRIQVGNDESGNLVLTDEKGDKFTFYTAEGAWAFLQATKLKHVKHEEKR